MKNKNQIDEYLSKSSWFLKFKRNVYLKNKTGDKSIQNLIKIYPREFIDKAFTWHYTKEGSQYWYGIYFEYVRWFDND